MKLIFLLVCGVGLLTSVAEKSYAQSTKLTFALKNTTIKDVLEHIENNSEFSFMYENNVVDVEAKVDIAASDETIDVILNRLLGDDIEYRVIGRHIVLFPSGSKQGEILPTLSQQQRTVSGTVTDETGQPLPGVTVLIKGTTQGTVTNADGNYSLTNIPEDATLQFSFVGMLTQEIEVGNQTTIDVTMKMDAIGIEEVVAVGYGVQKKATLTGSIGSVQNEEINIRPAVNTTELLQGQIAGLVTRQSSGLPGSDGTTLSIRGYGNALILVDGIPSSLGNIDPNDIESISVLKDASAAVYGAQAGNGVILVTTKRGTQKPSQINYHGTVSFTQPTFLPKMVNARQWAQLIEESGLDPNDYVPGNVLYDPESNSLTNILDGSPYQGYNWRDAVLRDWTAQHQHNLSASGGTEKMSYFISGGFTDQESNLRSGDYDFGRYNIRSNVDAKITDNLQVSLDFAYRRTELDKANFTVDDMYNTINKSKPVYPYIHEADPTRASYPGTFNSPYYEMNKDYSGFILDRQNVITGAVEVKYKFPMIKGLTARGRLSFEDVFSWNKNVLKTFQIWEYDPIAANENSDPWILRGTRNQNKMYVYADRSNEMLPLVSLEYEKTIGGHNLKAMVVNEIHTYKWTNLRGDRYDLLSYEAPYLNFASNDRKDNAEIAGERARSSVIGRFNYDYLSKYLFEFAMRADASAEYPKDGRWGYFPSFSAGWRISEESFMKDNFPSINSLKLRGSYGILGNDAVSSFDYLTGYNITGDFYVFGSTPAPTISSAGLANPFITWETMKIANFGVDGILWDGLLGFELDVFYRLREDILAVPMAQVPSTFGASLPRTNLNKMDNRGFELVFTHKNKIGNLGYIVQPMVSWSRGKYVDWEENVLPVTGDLDEETKELNRLWNNRYVREGNWDDFYWGYITQGFFMNQAQIDEHPVDQDLAGNQTLRVGDVIYKDLNGDNLIDWRDQAVLSKGGLPKTMYSLDLGLDYKGFGLSMLWQGGSGYTVSFARDAAGPFHNESIPLEIHYDYRGIVEVDDDGAAYITNPGQMKLPPVTQSGLTANNSKVSDLWSYDARFLRLKNLNISYALPKRLIAVTGLKQCQVYVSGTNLLTLSNLGIWKDTFDPEITYNENKNYPPVKTLTLGLRLTL